MSIVRDIVEAWGGQFRLEESQWGGVRVVIELPRI